MPIEINIPLKITVNTEAEARIIMEAAYSGLASELVKIGVLHGQIMRSGVTTSSDPTPAVEVRNDTAPAEPTLELVETVVKGKSLPTSDTPPESRPRGLAGRKRMGRS